MVILQKKFHRLYFSLTFYVQPIFDSSASYLLLLVFCSAGNDPTTSVTVFSLFQQTTPLEQTIFCIPKEAVTIAGGHFRTFVGAAVPQMLIRQQRCPGNHLRDF